MIDFERHPERYRHWSLSVNGDIATLVMAVDRAKMSQAMTNGLARPASNPYGEGSWVKCKDDGALKTDAKKAAELIKGYGKPVQFKMLFTATPRGRANSQVLQQFWKQIGADMEIELVDQATFPPRAFQRKFDIIGWRIVDIYLNGTVSELALRRSEYSALIQREGFEALLVKRFKRVHNLAGPKATQS